MKIAYFSQHQVDELVAGQTPLDHVRARLPEATEAEARSKTAILGFGAEKADTKIVNLSGGEKARLLLGLITMDGPHMMILDEPTNHLDIDSREALADALNVYGGAVLLITHDAHLAELVADRLWLVRDGAVTPYDGDLSAYRSLILETRKAKTDAGAAKSASQQATTRRTAAAQRDALAPLKKNAEAEERRLEKLNQALSKLDSVLADGELYRTDPPRALKLQKERAALTRAIETAEDAWMLALEAYEAAQQA